MIFHDLSWLFMAFHDFVIDFWSKIDLLNRFLQFLTKYGELGGPQATETYCRDETDLMEHAGSSDCVIQDPGCGSPYLESRISCILENPDSWHLGIFRNPGFYILNTWIPDIWTF